MKSYLTDWQPRVVCWFTKRCGGGSFGNRTRIQKATVRGGGRYDRTQLCKSHSQQGMHGQRRLFLGFLILLLGNEEEGGHFEQDKGQAGLHPLPSSTCWQNCPFPYLPILICPASSSIRINQNNSRLRFAMTAGLIPKLEQVNLSDIGINTQEN